MLRRGFQGSNLRLLELVFMLGIISLSTRTFTLPLGSIGSVLNDQWIDPKLAEFAAVATSQPTKEPILLRYITGLFGNDWLGADWLYIGLGDYRYLSLDKNGQHVYATNPVTGVKSPQWNYARFWTDPGPALLKIGDTLWVWGYNAGSHTIYADSILVNPPARIAPPDDVSSSGSVIAVSSETITMQPANGVRATVIADQYTSYSFPIGEGLPHPQNGLWLHISWLTGSAGWLGRYDGYQGTYRGILRLDFRQP